MEILITLNNLELSSTELSSNLGQVSTPEVSRHLTTLNEQGLVIRDNHTRKYTISDLGKIFVTMIEPIQFIIKNMEYFRNHRIDDLPNTLMTQINMLSNSRFTEKVGHNMLELEKLIDGARNELWAIVDSGFTFKNKKIQKMRVITSPELLSDVSKDEHMKTHFERSYPSMKNITYKVIPRVNLALILVDSGKAGAIAFPKTGEFKPDYSTGFFINDEDGIHYLQQIFKYFWKEARLP
jgi:predicted transcriptional regulator